MSNFPDSFVLTLQIFFRHSILTICHYRCKQAELQRNPENFLEAIIWPEIAHTRLRREKRLNGVLPCDIAWRGLRRRQHPGQLQVPINQDRGLKRLPD